MWTLETSMTQPQEFLQPPKVALALDRYLRGLEVQGMHLVGVLANPKDPQTWKVGHDLEGRLGQAPSKVALVLEFEPLGRWAMQSS